MQREGQNLKKYLLGTLPEIETRQFDLRVISNENFTEDLLLAEHDLIEDYLEGVLSAEESERFESDFLTSPERRSLLHETSLLKNFAKKNAPVKKVSDAKVAESKGTFFGLYFRPLVAVAGVAAVIVASLIWLSFSGTFKSPLEREYAQLNKRDLSDITQLTEYSSIDLVPGNFRGVGTMPRQSAQSLTDPVLFRLALPSNFTGDSEFTAKIEGSRISALELGKIRANRGSNGQELRLLVPKSILQPGQYQINVSGTDNSPVGTYIFVVE